MVHRGLRAVALTAALTAGAVAALVPSASAGTITIEGFRAFAPPNGAPIPQPAAKPGTRMTKCQRKDAIMVIFKYRGMNEARDKIKVTWFRNGKAFFLKSRAIAPDGTDGRAFRSLSPGVPNGAYKANVLVNGKLAKSATVVKACPACSRPVGLVVLVHAAGEVLVVAVGVVELREPATALP